jgi:hypothetical protein
MSGRKRIEPPLYSETKPLPVDVVSERTKTEFQQNWTSRFVRALRSALINVTILLAFGYGVYFYVSGTNHDGNDALEKVKTNEPQKLLSNELNSPSLTPETLGTISKECLENLGNVDNFGSLEQGEMLKELVVDGCDFVGLQFKRKPKNSKFTTLTFLAYDKAAAKVFRLKMDLAGVSWISWREVSKADILDEDPSDGFDFGKVTFSQSGENYEDPRDELISQKIYNFYWDALERGAHKFMEDEL